MKKILASAVLVLALTSIPAFAKGKPAGHGNNDKHEKSEKWKDKDRDKNKDHKKDWGKRDHDREHGRATGEGRPPGWDKGKKTGWGNCDVPPGQAKKQGCRSTRRRPVVTQQRRRTYPPRRPTTTTTTTSTTTASAKPPAKKGEHPFTPVLREKQQAKVK